MPATAISIVVDGPNRWGLNGKICRKSQENTAPIFGASVGNRDALPTDASWRVLCSTFGSSFSQNLQTSMLLRLQNAFRSMTSMIREQERIANNLANAGTIGYKQDRTFTETLDEYLDVQGGPQSNRSTEQWASLEHGAFEATGGRFDFAIESEGFFVLTDESTGTARYTRAGRFAPDDGGMLRDPNGHLVEGQGGPIQIPRDAETITVSSDGTVRADEQEVGQLRLVRFEDPMALERVDGASFTAQDMEPMDVEDPSIRQGFIETSNVDPITEMTQMISRFRQFESQQKVLRTHDQILGHVTRELGKF